MKLTVTRFKCDAPECKEVTDVEGIPQTPTTIVSPAVSLPAGWIEFTVTGATPGAQPALVHAHSPECAKLLAGAQVEQAVEVAETEAKEEEERAKQAEKDRKAAEKEAEKSAKAEAKRVAEEEAAAAEEETAAEKKASESAGGKNQK